MPDGTSPEQPTKEPTQLKPGDVIAEDVSASDDVENAKRPLFDSGRAIFQGDIAIGLYKPQYDKHIKDDDAKTGLILILDQQKPVYMPYGKDLIVSTGCATAEDYLKLVSELSPQEPTPEHPTEPPQPPQ